MKKRLMAFLLCLVMVLSVVLVGCSEDKDVETEISTEGSKNARSLTMWVVSEKEVDAETASAVNDALNSITRSKFKANLVVKFFTQEEYRSAVSETIRAYEDSKNYLVTGNSTEEAETSAETETYVEETVTNEWGQVTTKFPEVLANQVDIIYIDGYDMYNEYIANGWLEALDSELSASSKKIKEYISSALLSAAKLNGATYAIPNNSTIGEYTYMLLDKELMEETFMDGVYKQGKIDGMFNEYIFSYLDTVRQHHTDVVPVAASYDDCLNLLAHYWSIDPETYDAEQMAFSFLGYRYTDPTTLSKGQTVLSFDSLFADEVFCENFAKLNEYRLDGQYFFADEAETEKRAAIRFCTGDLADYEKYAEDYYPVIVKYPSVDIEDVYTNMFGVCKYSVDVARSMQIITYLTSNADFRNTLQYGVEGVHYELVENDGKKTVSRLNENYMMDLFKTGNAFIAYPEPTMDQNIWEVGKQQNRQAKVEPLLNFDFAQIAQSSGNSTAATPSLGTKSYQYSFTTGYSKDVLSENERLNEWFKACDQAGNGVYILHTSLLSGQNLTGKIYYYNNHITNASVTMNDADQNVTVNYSGTAGDGYEITVIDFYGKKNASILNWKASVNGSDAAAKITYQNSVLNFDLFHTEHYSVDLTSGLTKAGVVDNDAVWAWIGTCSSTGANVATYAKTANGKTVYTYVFFENNVESSVSVQPTGNSEALRVTVNYSRQGSSDKKYMIFLVTVTVDEGTTVTFDLKQNGEALNATTTEFAEDPMFRKCGQLDTELVNYVYKINQQVMGLINACTTAEELHAVIDDLHILFTPITKQPLREQVEGVLPRLTNESVKAFAESLDLEEFYWFLYSATSNTAVVHKDYDENEKVSEVKTDPKTGESYVYYSSPYMLYYAWLKSNGYVK